MAQRNYLVSATALSLDAGGTTIASGNTSSTSFVVAQTLVRAGIGAAELLATSQTWAVHYVVSAVSAATLEMRLKIQRRNSSGAMQSESGYTTIRNAVGTYDDNLVWTSGTWAAGDELALVWEHRKTGGGGNRSETIDANGASYIDAPAPVAARTGSGSGSASVQTGAGSGAVVGSGSGSASCSVQTGSGSGAVAIVGSGSGTTSAQTGSGSGTVGEAARTGSGAGTASAQTGSGSGSVVSSGAGSGTVSAQSGSGSGAVIASGAGSANSSAQTGSGSGAVTIAGSGSASVTAQSGAGTGSAIVSGSGSGDVAAQTGSGTGTVTDGSATGYGAGTASAQVGSGTGAVSIMGSGNGAASAQTSAGSGTVASLGKATSVAVLEDLDYGWIAAARDETMEEIRDRVRALIGDATDSVAVTLREAMASGRLSRYEDAQMEQVNAWIRAVLES